MKILFVQKVKALVGSEKYFLELIPALEERGVQTEFVCIYSEIDKDKTQLFIDAYQKLGLKLHVLEIKNEKQILKSVRFVRRVFKTGNFDLIHSHLIHADLWCALLKKIYKVNVPIVSTKHGYDEAYISKHGFSAEHLTKNRYYKICKFSEKSIHQSFAVSEGLRSLFISSGICTADKIETIHHGFDLPELAETEKPAFRYSPHQIVILGRVIPFKGHMLLIQALPKIKEVIPDFKLLVIGHGDADILADIEKFKEENQLKENVELLGYQSNIYDYLGNSDLMIVPSIAEGFGLIFLEALNAKLPIIGFDVAATNEIIEHEKTGILIPPYDIDLLAEAIIKLLQDENLKNNIAEQGYNRLKDYFSLDRMVSQTVQFYQSAVHSYNNKDRSE